MRALFSYALILAIAHFGTTLWHLAVLSKVGSALGLSFVAFIVAMNLLPFAGVLLLRSRFENFADWFFLLPFGLPLVFGGYAHFIGSGPQNLFQMKSGPWTASFRIGATILAVLEILAGWLGIGLIAPHRQVTSRTA